MPPLLPNEQEEDPISVAAKLEEMQRVIDALSLIVNELQTEKQNSDGEAEAGYPDDVRAAPFDYSQDEDEKAALTHATIPDYIGDAFNNGLIRTDDSIFYIIVNSGNSVQLSIVPPDPIKPGPLPNCTELPNPWIVATIAGFPFRFKKTSNAGGVVQWESLGSEELPLITYRNAYIYYTDLQPLGFPLNGAITISGSGTTRYYLTVDLTIGTSSAWGWASSTSPWATIDNAHDDDTEIIPVLTINYSNSVIQWWVQHQWGTVRMPSNA